MLTTPSETTDPRSGADEDPAPDSRNEVLLRGRISAAPTLRELPSGAKVVTFRLVVARSPTVMTRGSRQRSDWVECSAWSGDQRRKVSRWVEGDVVEVGGSLRRRHYRSAQAVGSVVEVEVLAARRITRA